MQTFATRAYRVLSRVSAPLGVALVLISCGSDTPKTTPAGDSHSTLVSLNPSTDVVAGNASQCTPTCPDHGLPDQCGTWAGVELRASRLGDKRACEKASDVVSHCLCAPIEFKIPDRLPVTSGVSGWDWDKPELTFRDSSGRFVECRYRGTGSPLGKKPAAGAPDYLLDGCDYGYRAGDTAHGDWFELDLGKCQSSSSNVEVSLRLGAPDVVDGVVGEQVFFSDDPQLRGAALHVPRGAAPPFETFSLDRLAQVTPGLAIGNGSNPVTSITQGVDVHSDQTSNIVFATVPGADCPRLELPYDPAALKALVGPGGESAIRAEQITTLTGLTTGAAVLAPKGPVTVNLAQQTLSFCVEHLSFYLGVVNSYDSLLDSASISGSGLSNYPLVTGGTPAGSLPLLRVGADYTLQLKFKNPVTNAWALTGTSGVALVPVSVTYGTSTTPTSTVITSTWNPTNIAYSWTNAAPVALNGFGTVSLKITAPTPSAPLNFCLARTNATPNTPFGACFSWDTSTRGGTSGVPVEEDCDGNDNDLDGKTDNVPGTNTPITRTRFTGPAGTENVGICKDGVQTCTAGVWVDSTVEVKGGSETCNHLDDDCDGQVDNATAAEVCDGVDNDCDGKTDEDCPIDFDYLDLAETMHPPNFGTLGAPTQPGDASYSDVCSPRSGGRQFADGLPIKGSSTGVYAIGLLCARTAFFEKTSVTPFEYSLSWTTGTISEPTGGVRGGFLRSTCSEDGKTGLMTGLRGADDGDSLLAIEVQCADFSIDNGTQLVHEVSRYWSPALPNADFDPPLTLGTGGNPFQDECPPDQYIAHITHRAPFSLQGGPDDGGVRVHNVSFTCARIGVKRQ